MNKESEWLVHSLLDTGWRKVDYDERKLGAGHGGV